MDTQLVPYSKDVAHGLLLDMTRIRRMEEKAAQLYSASKIRGFLHLYVGQEAVAVGVMHALDPDDAVVATYREHGHALVRGVPMDAIMAEMFGKKGGCSGGRGGSMHLFDASTRFYGGNAIVAGGLPVAVGLALADAMQERKRVTACFFGDGAVAEGAFHESMNLAALWHLPVLFCCENNFYAMGTSLVRSHSQPDLCAKASAFKVPAHRVDGMDVVAAAEAARDGAEFVRNTGGPLFLEFQTYRFRAHSMFDPELYRDKAEVESWKKRDPLATFTDRLVQQHLITENEIDLVEKAVAEEISAAVDFAEDSPVEGVDSLYRNVMTPHSGTVPT